MVLSSCKNVRGHWHQFCGLWCPFTDKTRWATGHITVPAYNRKQARQVYQLIPFIVNLEEGLFQLPNQASEKLNNQCNIVCCRKQYYVIIGHAVLQKQIISLLRSISYFFQACPVFLQWKDEQIKLFGWQPWPWPGHLPKISLVLKGETNIFPINKRVPKSIFFTQLPLGDTHFMSGCSNLVVLVIES